MAAGDPGGPWYETSKEAHKFTAWSWRPRGGSSPIFPEASRSVVGRKGQMAWDRPVHPVLYLVVS